MKAAAYVVDSTYWKGGSRSQSSGQCAVGLERPREYDKISSQLRLLELLYVKQESGSDCGLGHPDSCQGAKMSLE